MEIYPLEAPTTYNSCSTTIGFSNSYSMEKSLPTIESTKSIFIFKPPFLHFLHVSHISYIFKLGSQFAQHEKTKNSISLHIKYETKVWPKGWKFFTTSHNKTLLSNTPQAPKFFPQTKHKFWNVFSTLSLIYAHDSLIYIYIHYVINCWIIYSFIIPSQWNTLTLSKQPTK